MPVGKHPDTIEGMSLGLFPVGPDFAANGVELTHW